MLYCHSLFELLDNVLEAGLVILQVLLFLITQV